MVKLRLILFLLAGFLMLHSSVAISETPESKQSSSFEDGINAAKKYKQKPLDLLRNFSPKDTFKNYTDKPVETQYYQGITQTSSTLKEEAIQKANESEAGKAVNSADQNLKSIDHLALKNEIKKISLIQDHAEAIVKGVSDEFIDCTNQSQCTTSYEEKMCLYSPNKIMKHCTNKLFIDFIPHQTETHYTLHAHLSVKEHNYAGINVNTTNGGIIFLGPRDARFSLEGRLPSNVDCKTLQGKLLQQQGDAHLDYLHFPSCSNGLNMDFHFSGGHRLDLEIDMVSTNITYEIKDRWEDGCLGLKNTGCQQQEDHCVTSKETRIIQNTPITRDCWEKESTFLCGSHDTDDCAPFRERGCVQINSQCMEPSDGGCQQYSLTFRCQQKECKASGIICNGKTFFLDGDCIDQKKESDTDFQQVVSALSSTFDAAKQYDQHFVFQGKAKECRNFMLGAAYCCQDEGWLLDTNLLACNEEEKELGQAKENGLAHYVGRYEEGCVGNVCIKKIKAYCIYPSKLARIIQEGAAIQLGRHFGDGNHPDCSGLTIKELQKIDFSLIDFSEFYADIANKTNLENPDKANQRISDKIHEWVEAQHDFH